ncbi:MAG: DUF4276 family protein [Lysobacterales bacterium]
MRELVCLLEEESARAMLESLLPRVLDPSICCRLIAFEGKQDLEHQLTRKVRSYMNPQARFLVVRDQDSAPDCRQVKNKLMQLCHTAGRAADCLVRIACRELEAIYLADLAAVESVTGIRGLARHQTKSKYRDPDALGNSKEELKKLTGGKYQEVSSSRELGKVLQLDNPRSSSFRQLLAAVRKLQAELLALP